MATRRASIAMYHHILDDSGGVWAVTRDRFASQVDGAIAAGMRFGALEDLTGPDDLAVITFDDALASVYENAFPILSRRQVRATVFVPVNFAGGMNTYDYFFNSGTVIAARIMDWAQLRELASEGWRIQSHGCSHLPLSCLGPEHLKDELVRSKKTIEDHIGVAVDAFSYPFGVCRDSEDEKTFELELECAGYRMAVLANGGRAACPPKRRYAIPRIPMANAEEIV